MDIRTYTGEKDGAEFIVLGVLPDNDNRFEVTIDKKDLLDDKSTLLSAIDALTDFMLSRAYDVRKADLVSALMKETEAPSTYDEAYPPNEKSSVMDAPIL